MVMMLLFLLISLGIWMIYRGHRWLAISCWLVTFLLAFVSISYHMTDPLNISL
jgi:hypothetical protein